MPELPVLESRQVIAALGKAGFCQFCQKGSLAVG